MAQIDRFMIAPITGGMQKDLKPWLIPDDAFETLQNCYLFRGRIRKRFGSRLMQGIVPPAQGYQDLPSRLRILIGTTDGSGGFIGYVPKDGGNVLYATGAIGQQFSCGNQVYTVNALGTPADLLNTGSGTATFDTSDGDPNSGLLIIVGASASTAVYYYPALPVMGLVTYEQPATNDELIFGFDTRFAYQFATTGWVRLGTAVWSGDNDQFFWGSNWRGLSAADTYLYITNYNTDDGMKYWDGSAWNLFAPNFTSGTPGDIINTARIILPFKDRLILLNTVETSSSVTATYVNRCRYSWNGSPTDATAFYQKVPGKGGYIDAPTKEAIITAQFLKDRLIVYFERSTWELVYTANQILPFVWQKINTELGAESTFSQVPFDKFVLGVGNVGIHACNGSNVERIDEKIPDIVFEIHDEQRSVQRVAGIRDFYTEMVYWAFPGSDRTEQVPYNNRVLVYNYKNQTWSYNTDSITAFGYYQASANEGETWGSDLTTWESDNSTWKDGANIQAKFRSVLAGNQQGFVFIVDNDYSVNSPSLSITDMSFDGNSIVTVTCINHNLEQGFDQYGDYIYIVNVQGATGVNGKIYPVYSVVDENTFTIEEPDFDGVYTGSGSIARVSNVVIETKQYNFYQQQGSNAFINKIDFLVTKTDDGQCVVDYAVSSSNQLLLDDAVETGAIMDHCILETSPYELVPLEQSQTRLWHSLYPQAEGEYIQLSFYLNEEQMRDPDIAFSIFELHAMIFYAQQTGRLQ